MSKWGSRTKPPPGFQYVEPTLDALDDELRDRMNDPTDGQKKNESLWPVHQINWQKSRYIYDLYYKHKRIAKPVYDYCLKQKLVDAALIAKWKKPGYDKLCSTYVINTKNFPFGTVSICRVPRSAMQQDTNIKDANTGCRGCASGTDGYDNIFGNKYGQDLAKLQIVREDKEKSLVENTEAKEPRLEEDKESTDHSNIPKKRSLSEESDESVKDPKKQHVELNH